MATFNIESKSYARIAIIIPTWKNYNAFICNCGVVPIPANFNSVTTAIIKNDGSFAINLTLDLFLLFFRIVV